MTKKLFAIRIDGDIEKRLEHFMSIEDLDRSSAGRKLLALGLKTWGRKRALELLKHGEISLTKAAEMSGISLWGMLEIVKKEGIPLRVSKRGILEDIREGL